MKFSKFTMIFLVSIALTGILFAGEKEAMAVHHDKGYLVFKSDDGQFKYWIDGRIMVDYGTISNDNNFASGWETRRARFSIKSIIKGDWAGEFDFDLADNEVEIKDFWMSYIGFNNTIIKLGNHKVPGSMEDMTTSRWITFMERGLPNEFTIGRRMGISYNHWGENYLVMGGYFGEEPGEGEESGNDEEGGIGLRAAYAPIHNDDTVLHFGLSYTNFSPNADDSNKVRMRSKPELHLTQRLLNTGKVKHVDDYSFTGLEVAFQKGAFSGAAEYLEADLNRYDGDKDASYSGYYAYVSWFAFGAKRTYSMDSAEFGAIHPRGHKGALELAFRMSNLDLNDFDAGVEGGSADNYTFGINWYANENVRIMFNYIRSDNDEFADGDGDWEGNDTLDIYAVRFQYLF